MEQNDKPTTRYIVFVKNNPPQMFESSTDLVQSWMDQHEAIAKAGDWNRLIVFKDDDGSIGSAYSPHAILAVMKGIIPAPGGPALATQPTEEEKAK